MNTLERLREIRAEFQEAARERRTRVECPARAWLADALGCTSIEVPGHESPFNAWWRLDLPDEYSLRFKVGIAVTCVLERQGGYFREATASLSDPPTKALGYLLTTLGVDLEGGSE